MTSGSSRDTLGDPAAQSRYFVAQDGTRRLYQFKKSDDHRLELATLARQLSASGWAARDRFDAGKLRQLSDSWMRRSCRMGGSQWANRPMLRTAVHSDRLRAAQGGLKQGARQYM